MQERNPIIEVYNGVAIRKNNRFVMRMGPVMFKTLILESERTGLPISKIIAHSSKPCDRCCDFEVVVFRKGKEIKIKRGILSRHIPEGNGTSIIKQANAKKL